MSHDRDAVCVCVSEHRPSVLEFIEHHILPSGMGGPNVDDNKVWLCPTTHYNVHELLRLMVEANIQLSDRQLQVLCDRPVSRYAAQVARDGFTRWRPAPLRRYSLMV